MEMKGPTNNISVIEDDSGPLEKISLNITLFNCSMQHKSSPMVAHDLDSTVTSSDDFRQTLGVNTAVMCNFP